MCDPVEREGNLEAVAVRTGALLKYTPPAPVFAALRPAFNINYAEVLIPISVPKRTGLPGEPARSVTVSHVRSTERLSSLLNVL
ncbi:hypothetical protein LSTR_LSTR016408 [Laodelphax striatellus]|uniref:Uncharacterized protein n=1 Tax=Laodelphax striatellus TaxID=195883 RepID=A0A482X9V7_LAOST|nr:hypothetical protein LSTR_LSTR016408 [Laodelphax striatellus]